MQKTVLCKVEDYSRIVSSIRATIEGVPPQINIVNILRKHGCIYLLSKHLPAQKMNSFLRFNSITIGKRYAICKPLFQFLWENHIKFVVMKGAVLSQAAYGNFAIRKSSDIDLFVSRDCIDQVKKHLLDLGFVQGRVTAKGIVPFNRADLIFYTTQSHQLAPFVKRVGGSLLQYINLDINTNLLWGESNQYLDSEVALSHWEETEICGVRIKKFTPEFEFIALCLHHYKDMNSMYLLYNGSLTLDLFCDIYFYIVNGGVDFSCVKKICDKYQIRGVIYYCIYYTNEIFGGLEEYLNLFFDLDAHNNLDKFGTEKANQKAWNCSFYQRLFSDDFNQYFRALLNENDMRKIQDNQIHI